MTPSQGWWDGDEISIGFAQINLSKFDWIGLRENLQETIDFPIKYGSFL